MLSRSIVNRRVWAMLLLLVLSFFCTSCSAARRKKPDTTSLEGDVGDINAMPPQAPYLVDLIGKEIYNVVKKPKYKFYIYMTIGTLPNEESTIFFLSTICNILYGILVFSGFWFFPRGPMLFWTLATLWIGPALVLILLGAIGMVLAAFAVYPLTSVSTMCLWFFLTSQLAQTLGKRWGLDTDQDGDVDWLDLLHAVAQTKMGKALQLDRLHVILNQANQNPFQELHHRLDVIHRNTSVGSILIKNGEDKRNGHQKTP